jgi:uncharacterized repeat protein (TIGR03803 family)
LQLTTSLAIALALLGFFGVAQSAKAQIVTLGTFDGANGALPQAGLTLSSDGTTFYGTTSFGGSNNNGTVFSIAVTGGTISTVADFTQPAVGPSLTGTQPLGAVTLGSDGGTLYGTTSNGGTGGPSGGGTIYSVSATGSNATPTTLAPFTGISPEGATPQGSLTLSGSTLYGTTYQGGANRVGTVFSESTSGGAPTTLASFDYGTNGANPSAGLILSGGILYGTTSSGGSGGNGTIFSVSASGGPINTLATFSGDGSNGAAAVGNLILVGNTFYGTTSQGGTSGDGTVFSFNLTTSTLTTLASFNGVNGALPKASLTLNGGGNILYGTTYQGGADGDGTVFSLNLDSNVLVALASFTGTDGIGANPQSDLNLIGNILYGTTFQGGVNGEGTVFSFDTAAIPEPSLWPLSLISLGVLACLRQRIGRGQVD